MSSQIPVFLKLAPLIIAVLSCRTFETKSDPSRVQPEEPQGSKNLTASRVIALNQWATRLLEETKDIDDFQAMAHQAFGKMGVTDAEPLKIYSINLRPGTECFRDSTPGHSLWWARHRDQVARQIESAAHFLYVYHLEVFGKPKGPFAIKEVEICPKSTVKSDLYFFAGKLVIGVPFHLVQGYRPWTSDELLRKWRAGEHFLQEGSVFNRSFTQSKLRKIWTLFDPIGSIRIGLRQSFQDQAKLLRSTLNSLSPAESLDMWKSKLWTQVVDVNRLRYTNDQSLEKIWKEGRTDSLLKNWRCLALRASTADDFSWGALSTFERELQTNQSKIDIKIRSGLVAVGNYHQIGVRFTFSQSPYEEYFRVGTSGQTELKADVQGGLVAVFTVDDVKVDVAMSLFSQMVPKTLATATFDSAVLATRDEKDLCGST